MYKTTIIVASFLLLLIYCAEAANLVLPEKWNNLSSVLESRLSYTKLKMKLYEKDKKILQNFLSQLKEDPPKLLQLQYLLPRTTLELIRSMAERGVKLCEAEKIADYLEKLVKSLKIQNIIAFDENTSHIIGREWEEIDYTGEGMTAKAQRKAYLPYGVTNFKTIECIVKFFAIESKLPYFKKTYSPLGSLPR